MRLLRGVFLLAVLVQGLAGCRGSGAPSAPSMPPPAPGRTVSKVTGYVWDSANRPLAGAGVEVLDGLSAGASTTADTHGAFSLTGTFDATTRFRATKDGYVSATQPVQAAIAAPSVFFWLDGPAAPVNIAGDYTLSFVADSACADLLPDDIRTRTYPARISEGFSPNHPAHTYLIAALSGATLDGYYNRMSMYVAGDYLAFDLSDNSILEEVEDDAYLSIGGVGAATVGTAGASTISGSLKGVFDYCVAKSEMKSGFHCDPAEATARATCSGNHQVILTRR
jgi:carboxypeptidase family protein